ncbi:hypothetical protein J6590_065838 [Homalodisca vitripennis]|nr:hypothetical protein J6590_065838 [Homalodisca vitripennis]
MKATSNAHKDRPFQPSSDLVSSEDKEITRSDVAYYWRVREQRFITVSQPEFGNEQQTMILSLYRYHLQRLG